MSDLTKNRVSKKNLVAIALSCIALIILNHIRVLFDYTIWDCALKPGNVKAFNFASSFFNHVHELHFYTNLFVFCLLCLCFNKGIVVVWLVLLLSGWIGNMVAIFTSDSMILGCSGGLAGLAVMTLFNTFSSALKIIPALYLVSMVFSAILEVKGVSHYSHLGGTMAGLLICYMFKMKSQKKERVI